VIWRLSPPNHVKYSAASRDIIVVGGCAFGWLAPGAAPQVLQVGEDSEAARAGIHNNDLLVSVNGQPIEEWSREDLFDGLHDAQSVTLVAPCYDDGTHSQRGIALRRASDVREEFADDPPGSGGHTSGHHRRRRRRAHSHDDVHVRHRRRRARENSREAPETRDAASLEARENRVRLLARDETRSPSAVSQRQLGTHAQRHGALADSARRRSASSESVVAIVDDAGSTAAGRTSTVSESAHSLGARKAGQPAQDALLTWQLTPPSSVKEVEGDILLLGGCALGFLAAGEPIHVLGVEDGSVAASVGVTTDAILLRIDDQDTTCMSQAALLEALRSARCLEFARHKAQVIKSSIAAEAKGDEEEDDVVDGPPPGDFGMTAAERALSRARAEAARLQQDEPDVSFESSSSSSGSSDIEEDTLQPPTQAAAQAASVSAPAGKAAEDDDISRPPGILDKDPPFERAPLSSPQATRAPAAGSSATWYGSSGGRSCPPAQSARPRGEELGSGYRGSGSTSVGAPPGVVGAGPYPSAPPPRDRSRSRDRYGTSPASTGNTAYGYTAEGAEKMHAPPGVNAPPGASPYAADYEADPMMEQLPASNIHFEGELVRERKRYLDDLDNRKKALLHSLTQQLKVVMVKIRDPATSERHQVQLQTLASTLRDKLQALAPRAKAKPTLLGEMELHEGDDDSSAFSDNPLEHGGTIGLPEEAGMGGLLEPPAS